MKRWQSALWKDGKLVEPGKEVERPDVDAFLLEVIEVCKKHNKSIGHEDTQGAFIVEEGFDEYNAKWLMDASVQGEEK